MILQLCGIIIHTEPLFNQKHGFCTFFPLLREWLQQAAQLKCKPMGYPRLINYFFDYFFYTYSDLMIFVIEFAPT